MTQFSPQLWKTHLTGWVVRGVFTEVQAGNRLQRAIIGMGSGQTDLHVVTVVDNLSLGAPKPLYEVDTEASSGKGPGAAPTLALNPYAAAARFVMAGHDLDKTGKQTATQITPTSPSAYPSGEKLPHTGRADGHGLLTKPVAQFLSAGLNLR